MNRLYILPIQGVPNNLTESEEQYIVVSRFSSVFSGINVSVNSRPDHPPGDPRGFAHSSFPGFGFLLLCLPWGLPGGGGLLNQSKSSIILKKKTAISALSLKQMGSSSFHMLRYARSEQCDLGPIYTITNTQRIRIYRGKLKFILVKISPGSGRLHGKHAKEFYSRFLLLRIYPGSSVHTSANMERIQICPIIL